MKNEQSLKNRTQKIKSKSPEAARKKPFPAPCASLFAMLLVLTLEVLVLPCSLFAQEKPSYLSITGPCDFQFPQDHGPHPGYRTEWWYYTGNLRSSQGEHFGFQLTFFRSQIIPNGAEKSWPEPKSAWRSKQLFVAHAALSDIKGNRFLHAESMARGALGIADARLESEITSVFLKNWSLRMEAEKHHLKAITDDFSLHLILKPDKKPVLHGNSGYSLKGSTPERSSCYYSFSRLETHGSIIYEGEASTVQGTAWMDHEFSSAPLEENLAGWDWFSLQLSDNTELMVYLLRLKKGDYNLASSGTFVDQNGDAVHLSRDQFKIEVLDYWTSSQTGIRYPSRWTLQIPSLDSELLIVPNLARQEMKTQETTRVTYWEGSVSINGKVENREVKGDGYVELTGYGKPFDAPL